MPQGGGSSGASAAALVGPFPLSYSQLNASLGLPIDLGSPFKVGQLVEPFAFFPTFFNNGNPDNFIYLGVHTVAGGVSLAESISYDGNAPNDEPAGWGVSGLYNPLSVFPRRAVYRIKQTNQGLYLQPPGSGGFTVGSIIVWAFVWTP